MDWLSLLSVWDYLSFFLVLFATFAAILWARRREAHQNRDPDSPLELLLMGRRLTLPLFVASLVATWYGGIFGVTALSFERGIFNFVTQGVFWYATYIFMAFALVKRVRRIEATGLPDLAGQLFGPRARALSGWLAYLNLVPIAYVMALGHFLAPFLGLGWWEASLIGLMLMYGYALTGGLRAVVFSDLVQCFVMVLAVWLIVVVCWTNHGGWEFLAAKLPASHWDVTGGNDWSALVVWGMIALGTLVDPNFHSRVQAAKDEATARRGILIATLIWFCFDVATTLGGLYARALYADAAPEEAYLRLGLLELPPGLKGFFLAGVLATILSTLDSYLFTAGATLSHDLLKRTTFWRLKLSMLFTGLLAWLVAPLFKGSIIGVWKLIGGLISASLLPALLYGLWRPGKLSEGGFLLSVGAGIFGTVALFVANHFAGLGVEEFFGGLVGSILGLTLSIARSASVVSRR